MAKCLRLQQNSYSVRVNGAMVSYMIGVVEIRGNIYERPLVKYDASPC